MPNTSDVDITGITANLVAGGHHLILYRSTAVTESPTPTACGPLSGVTGGDAPIIIAQQATSTLTLPTGVAYHFTAGQMVRIEMHYLNATQVKKSVVGTVLFTTGAPGTAYQAADIMFCGSISQLMISGIPPYTTNATLNPGFFAGNANIDFTKIKVFGLTSHEHWTGKEGQIWKAANSGDASNRIYDNTQWDAPPLEVFDDAHLLTFGAGQGLRWQCSYDTQDAVPQPTSTVRFGESARTDEMCFIWAYYFPSAGRFIGQGDCWQ
jgi:hypothetical protein